MVTVRVCSKLKQAENRLFLQMKSGRILDILLAFLIKKPKNGLLPTFSPDFTWNRQIWLFYAEKWIFFQKSWYFA